MPGNAGGRRKTASRSTFNYREFKRRRRPMMEKEAQGTDLEPHEQSTTMVGRDVVNNRIVVSLWTIQVVTVLFVVISMSIWMALVTGVPIDDVALGANGIFFLAFLMLTLFAECRVYMRRLLSIDVYVRLQVAKALCWAMVLLILLVACSGVEDAGIRVFEDAAKKLILPFLASLLYSVIIYRQDKATRTTNGPGLVEDLLLAAERLELASPG